jgi:integrase
MPLTDSAIKNAKKNEKPYKLFDGGGLYIEIAPSGGKLWRLKYRYAGKEKLLSLGKYPTVSLADARGKREASKKLLSEDIDPSVIKQQAKTRRHLLAANSFEVIARQWFVGDLATNSAGYQTKIIRLIERDAFPYIGPRPIAELTAPEILTVVKRVDSRSMRETAHRLQQVIGQIIRYAIRNGLAENDPTLSLRGALPPVRAKHMAAPAEDPIKVGELLRMLEAFKGGMVVYSALRLLPMLFCRPGELRKMRWEQLDLEHAEWRYTVSKTNTAHLVPLSKQAVLILKELEPVTKHLVGGWVFPSGRTSTSPMSDAAINAAYKRLGINTQDELTGHGWRAVARTMLHERLGFASEVIEHQLAHAVPDKLGTAYNRTRFITDRRRMMQEWADYLDKLKAGAEVIQLHKKA